mgnify:CR=1 FL=1
MPPAPSTLNDSPLTRHSTYARSRIRAGAPDTERCRAILRDAVARLLEVGPLILFSGNLLPLSEVILEPLNADEPQFTLPGQQEGGEAAAGAPPAAEVPAEHWSYAARCLKMGAEQVGLSGILGGLLPGLGKEALEPERLASVADRAKPAHMQRGVCVCVCGVCVCVVDVVCVCVYDKVGAGPDNTAYGLGEAPKTCASMLSCKSACWGCPVRPCKPHRVFSAAVAAMVAHNA